MTRQIIRTEEIDKIVSKVQKLTSYAREPYPLNSLSDREFEILIYFIYQKLTKPNVFDKVTLMSGVGERGRDVILSLKGKDIGVIQCKKYKNNIDKPTVAKEIIKFCLYQVVEGDLIPKSIKKFTYVLATSTGLTNTAKKLIRNSEIILEDQEQFEKWTNDVINDYSILKHLNFSAVRGDLISIIKRLNIEEYIPSDINKFLNANSDVADYFFTVQKVTDNKLLEKIIKRYLDPILSSVYKAEPQTIIEETDFKKQFKKYLEDSFEHYSYARTLVFGSQQKKLEDFYIPLTIRCKRNDNELVKITNYPEKVVKKYKKILISDTGGMGKSTIMKWFFLHSIKQNTGLPVFIELRSLKNNHLILDEIIKRIQPIDKVYDKRMILQIIAQGNFIFFLDGFDEIGIEHRDTVVEDLQNFILKANNNLFILTSRPETALFSFADFQEFRIEPLKKEEAFDLIRKLGNNNDTSKGLIEKIEEQKLQTINEFLINPLLVSLLYKKFEYRETLPFDRQGFYYGVFEALFEGHDITKDGKYIRDKKSKLNQTQFYQLLRALGFESLKSFEIEYGKTTLISYVNQALKQCPNLQVDTINFTEDLVTTVPLFLKDGDVYRWQHKSLQEFFAAAFICNDSKNEQEKILRAIVKSENFDKLKNVVSLCYEIDYKTFRNSILYDLCKEFIEYCENSFVEVRKNKNIPIEEIRKRQGFHFLNDLYEWYIMNINSSFKVEYGLFFIKIKQQYISDDDYSVIFMDSESITLIRNRVSVAYLISTYQQNIFFRENSVYRGVKEIDKNLFRFVERIERVFDTSITFEKELLSEDPLSILNNEKYFTNVNRLLTGRFNIDYQECLKLIEEVERAKREEEGNGLASGF